MWTSHKHILLSVWLFIHAWVRFLVGTDINTIALATFPLVIDVLDLNNSHVLGSADGGAATGRCYLSPEWNIICPLLKAYMAKVNVLGVSHRYVLMAWQLRASSDPHYLKGRLDSSSIFISGRMHITRDNSSIKL